MLIFWGTSQSVPQILNVVGSFGWTRSTVVPFIGICYKCSVCPFSCTFFLPKYLLYCQKNRLCQKHWFSGKVGFNDFCPPLCTILSSLIHISDKESPRSAVYTTWKICQSVFCKTQFWEEIQNRALFLSHPVFSLNILYALTVVISYLSK